VIENEIVVKEIVRIKANKETDYGYHKMTTALIMLGYLINHKKVHRIMKEQGLLHVKLKQSGKNRVRFRNVDSKGPLEVLEIDIKYKRISGSGRMAYILTIIDTFTRETLYWTAGYSMKQDQVKKAWEYVIVNCLQESDILSKGIKVEVRNDNGSQFEAKMIQEYLLENGINQVFTHPYTPEENGHIESFHAILNNSIGMEEYETLKDLENRLKVFYNTYNNIRLHGSICNLPPQVFKELWLDKRIKLVKREKQKTRFKLLIPYYQINNYLAQRKRKKSDHRAMRA